MIQRDDGMAQPPSGSHFDALLDRVFASADEQDAVDLLAAFHEGAPIVALRALLRSDSTEVAKVGAWIASELGAAVKPLMSDIAEGLQHPSRYVRFFLLDAVLAAATEADGKAVAGALRLVTDPDPGVQWKALRVVTRASRGQLTSGLAYLAHDAVGAQLQWLLQVVDTKAIDDIRRELGSRNPIRRLFGAVAAARFAEEDQSLLALAANSEDAVVRTFATDELASLG